jgi:single-strand DNA-binding protein
MAKKLNFPRINSLLLSGRLTRDVELRYTTTGTPVATLPIAFDRAYKGQNGEWQNETSFINVIVWQQTAEQCSSALKKGSPILVEGYLRTRSYTDSTGQNRKITEIVGRRIHFLEREDAQFVEEEPPNLPTEEPVETTKDDEVPF